MPADERAAAVVHRTLAHVPTVQVPGHQHDFFRISLAFDFGYGVPGSRLRQEFRVHFQQDFQLTACIQYSGTAVDMREYY